MIHLAIIIIALWIILRFVAGFINVFLHSDWFIRCFLVFVALVVFIGWIL